MTDGNGKTQEQIEAVEYRPTLEHKKLLRKLLLSCVNPSEAVELVAQKHGLNESHVWTIYMKIKDEWREAGKKRNLTEDLEYFLQLLSTEIRDCKSSSKEKDKERIPHLYRMLGQALGVLQNPQILALIRQQNVLVQSEQSRPAVAAPRLFDRIGTLDRSRRERALDGIAELLAGGGGPGAPVLEAKLVGGPQSAEAIVLRPEELPPGAP